MTTLRDRLDAAMAQLRPSQPVEAAPKKADPPGVIPESLVKSAKLASWIAFFALVYFLWLYTLDIAADRSASLHLTRAGQWTGDIQFWFPYIFGFAAVAVGIPYVAKIAIPVFMSLDWRANLWPKIWALFIALAVSLVVIAGTFTVQGHSIVEKGREALVAQETQQQGVAALQARRDAIKQRWETLTASSNTTLQAQAARAGVAGWDAYIAAAKQQVAAGTTSPQRLALIERAKGSAIAAEEYQKQMDDLTAQIAAAPTAASAAARVETGGAGWIQSTMDWLEGTRAILLSLVMDIVCLMMPWIALRLEQQRNRQLAMVRGETFVMQNGDVWADETMMIRDMRQEAKVDAAPMDAGYHGDVIYDGNTGEEMKWVEGHVNKRGKWVPGHYRKTGKKKPKVADDVGVVLDSDSRAARSGVEGSDDVFISPSVGDHVVGDSDIAAGGSVVADEGVSVAAAGAAAVDEPHADPASADALYASLFNEPGPELPGVDYGEEYGPPAPEKKLGADGKDGVLVSVAAE